MVIAGGSGSDRRMTTPFAILVSLAGLSHKNNPDPHGISSGDIIGVYCHWDGYPSHNGKILTEHYNNVEKIEELLSFGAMSSLDEDILSTKFYIRDLHELRQGNESHRVGFWSNMHDKPIFDYVQKQEYNYIFKDGKWLCYNLTGKEIDLY